MTFTFEQFPVVWTHRTWGESPDPEYPWAAFIYGEKGTLKASVNKYEFFPFGSKKATISGTPLMEEEKYPEDKTERDLERHVASAIREHWRNFLHCRETREKPCGN